MATVSKKRHIVRRRRTVRRRTVRPRRTIRRRRRVKTSKKHIMRRHKRKSSKKRRVRRNKRFRTHRGGAGECSVEIPPTIPPSKHPCRSENGKCTDRFVYGEKILTLGTTIDDPQSVTFLARIKCQESDWGWVRALGNCGRGGKEAKDWKYCDEEFFKDFTKKFNNILGRLKGLKDELGNLQERGGAALSNDPAYILKRQKQTVSVNIKQMNDIIKQSLEKISGHSGFRSWRITISALIMRCNELLKKNPWSNYSHNNDLKDLGVEEKFDLKTGDTVSLFSEARVEGSQAGERARGGKASAGETARAEAREGGAIPI